MKTIYSSIYKERHRKFGNGSIPPETAGEFGRQSSTVRGKQDRNPALLLGYTFVYGNHIYRSPAHMEPAGTMEEGQSGDRSPGVPHSLRGNEDGKRFLTCWKRKRRKVTPQREAIPDARAYS